MMPVRNALLTILLYQGVVLSAVLASVINSIPMVVYSVFCFIVWLTHIVFSVREHQRNIRFPVVRYRPDKSNLNRQVYQADPQPPYDKKEANG